LENLNDNEKKILEGLIPSSDAPKVKFRWDDNFQRRILGLILTDRYFLVQARPLIEPKYFSNEAHVLICTKLYEYFEQHQNAPEIFFLQNEVMSAIKDKSDAVKLYYKNELENILEAFIPSPDSREALLDKILAFAKMQSLRIAMDLSQKDLKKDPESEEIWTQIYERFQVAMSVNKNFDVGFEYFNDVNKIFEDVDQQVDPKDRFTSGFSKIDNSLAGGGCKRGEIYSFIGLPGKGKSLCLVKASVANVKEGKKVVYISQAY
jgi:replicative DNA helicase